MVYTKKSHIVKPRILESLTAFSCSFVFMWPFRGMLYWMFTVDNKDTVIFSLDVILLPLLLTLLISVTVSTLKQCFYIQLWTIYWGNCLQCLYCWLIAGNYIFKVDNANSRTRCETWWKLTIKIPERRLSTPSAIGVVLVSLLLTLNIFHTLL